MPNSSVAIVIEDNPHHRMAVVRALGTCSYTTWTPIVYRGRKIFTEELDGKDLHNHVESPEFKKQLTTNGVSLDKVNLTLSVEEKDKWWRSDGKVPIYLSVSPETMKRYDVFDGNFDYQNVFNWAKEQIENAVRAGATRVCVYLDLSWNSDPDEQNNFIKLLLCPESVAIRIKDDEWTGGLRLIRELRKLRIPVEFAIVAISTFGAPSMKALARHLGAHHTIKKCPALPEYYGITPGTEPFQMLKQRYATELSTVVSEVFQAFFRRDAFAFDETGITRLRFDHTALNDAAGNEPTSLLTLRRMLGHHVDGRDLSLPLDVQSLNADLASFWDFLFLHPEQLRQLEVESLIRAQENSALKKTIVGEHKSMEKIRKDVNRVASTDASVLIQGESGTGKELVARAVHDGSTRAGNPYVAVNVAALSPSLIESELFGHEKGAFTGAVTQKIGKFELANGGTLFLDEIGDMPMELQSRLLRVLEQGVFNRVGGNENVRADIRLITATHVNLAEAVAKGRFRRDLWFRINVFPISLPPLRDRNSDIPLLVDHFLRGSGLALSKEAENRLVAHKWPGNVRELRNVLTTARILSNGSVIDVDQIVISEDWTDSESLANTRRLFRTEDEIKRLIQAALKDTHGNQLRAAKLLEINRSTLIKWMKKLNITADR